MLLEVIVQSVADAKAAEAGGAHRLEVVREIERGGLTPSMDLVRAITAETALPLRVMVRENQGFELEAREMAPLRDAVAQLAAAGVDGIVMGFARSGELRLGDLVRVLDAAPGVRVTFHRAFDSLRNPLSAINVLAGVPQVDRILTSGGDGTETERAERLREYCARARAGPGAKAGATFEAAGNPPRMPLIIIAGGGVTDDMLSQLAQTGFVDEVHVGRAAREGNDPTAPVSAARVRLLRQLSDLSTDARR